MKLASFWHSGRIHNLGALCLASWLENGFEVDLYAFEPPENVPDGVTVKDAEPVLSAAYVDRLKPILHAHRAGPQSIANFSDLFRIRMMELDLGLWLDTDILLFRPFDVDSSKPFFAWEDSHRIGSPVFYLPKDSPMIADYNRVYDDPDLMPHWLGWRRRVLKPLVWRLQGKAFSPRDLGITIYGNDAFTQLAKTHGLTKYALGTKPFYIWNGKETERFYDPAEPSRIDEDPEVLGLHVHHKINIHRRPPEGSLFARALARYEHRLPADIVWEDAV
ncbi:hypothetical protein [Chachezhania antarctica]|uniref:hypothetical protein n=1 Tax=Chachezhania antarctica TaxID=2340860 RepID=UPI000EAEF356|nr:hypothetical protein [Chachezhania antarctica]|tara:strand:+ start:470 stop:1297 length:828 start_codon:yes stop_codon:yes gene_type:complete